MDGTYSLPELWTPTAVPQDLQTGWSWAHAAAEEARPQPWRADFHPHPMGKKPRQMQAQDSNYQTTPIYK